MIRVVLAIFLVGILARTSSAQDATEIVRRADQLLRGTTSYAELTMRIVRPDWSREVSLKSWSKDYDFALILITAPARDKGATFLKRKTEIWNWLPSVEKVIKIPPSMMMQSWMGSDFTNDDLVRESSVVHDYTHTLIGDTILDDRECWKIELIPKPEAAVVWGRIYVWITKEDDLELRAEYYDEQDELINTMTLSNIRELGGRVIPTYFRMIPADKPNHYTEMEYHTANWDFPIEDSFFSEQNMKRVQ
ncbi:MAG: outer membrane lipoprotein-sorting protein [Calditrichaeota bacterium]|nr:outer membrane lipoprotein-sorting protein [Calditrichota bacterium]